MDVSKVIGYLVATRRKAAGVSQKTVARLAELHPVALSKIERGVHGDMGINTFVRIAVALGEKPGELLDTAERISRRLPDDTDTRQLGVKLAALASEAS